MANAVHLAEDLSAPAVVQQLLHELRQPLSSIEAIAYYVEMTLPAQQLQARHHMQQLQDLVDQTNSILRRVLLLENAPPAKLR